MARITYLSNTGFVVELPKLLLVFDDVHDGAHTVVKICEHHPDIPVVFFVSSKLAFRPEIFNMAQSHKREYVLSNDVRGIADTVIPTVGMSAGDKIENVYGLTVRAFRSNGPGVVFAVTLPDGKTILHTGTLTPLPIEELSKRNSEHLQEMVNAKDDQRQVRHEHQMFTTYLDRIAAEVPQVDLAFVAIDQRLGKQGYEGLAQAVQTLNVANIVPMHYHGEGKTECKPDDYGIDNDKQTKLLCIHTPGESTTVDL